MREKTNKSFIDILAYDYINSLDDHFERSKVRTVLWITLLFSTVLSLTASLFTTTPYAFLLYLFAFLLCISVPLGIKKWENYQFPAKVLLSILMVINCSWYLIAYPITSLSSNIWFIVLIMAASFIVGIRWGLGFTITYLATLSLSAHFQEIGYSLGDTIGIYINLIDIRYLTPLGVVIPMFLMLFMLHSFIKNKHHTDKNVLNLLAEQQNLNQLLQKKEAKYRKIIEGADDMIYEINQHGYFTYMNPSIQKITGYTLGAKPLLFNHSIPKDYLEEHNAFFMRMMKTQQQFFYREFPIITTDGKTIWVGQKTNMFFDEKGRMVNALCLSRDITAQLETKERLIEAKERAIKASLLKAQFLSSMSHEIRTPMNAVIGLIHLLLLEKPRTDQIDHLNTLMFSAENLLKLINNILDFSKIEAGKIEIVQQSFSIGEIINSIQHGFGNQAKEKGIELVIRFDESIPDRLIGDPLRLSQILNNLVSNAIKFTDEGQVTLYAIPKNKTADALDLYFAIKDTGIGIPKEKLASVFEDFVQVNDDTLRQGTGLGLSITKQLLDLQGSKIHLESTFGEGSTFYFTLHFKVDTTFISSKKERYADIHQTSRVLKGLQLLLVEDNKINQKVATNFLKKWGVKVDIADNGLIAVDMVQQKQYGMVLMDLQMPIMNGIEATKAIRAMGGLYQELPIIALTASAVLEIKDNAIKSGLDDFITKPFKPNTLFEKIAEHTAVAVSV